MTEEQRQHAESVANSFRTKMIRKYEKGAAEHKSRLWADYTLRQMMAMANEEAIDLATYQETMSRMIEVVMNRLESYERCSKCLFCNKHARP